MRIEPEELVAQMDAHGIERAVIYSPGNARVARAVAAHPDRLLRTGLSEVRRGVDAGFCAVNACPADDGAVDPVVEAAGRLKVPVQVHSGHPPFSLPWSIGRPAARHPAVDFVMIHMGHGQGVYIQAASIRPGKTRTPISRPPACPCTQRSARPMRRPERIGYFLAPRSVSSSLGQIQKAWVSGPGGAGQRRVFCGNAARLLRL